MTRIPDVCPVCYWYSKNINGVEHCCRFLHHKGINADLAEYVLRGIVPNHCPLREE